MASGLMFPKPTRDRDDAFRDFVGSLPCLVCNRKGSDHHHLDASGVGTKGSDYSGVPLCREHHNEVGNIGRRRFEERHGLDLDEANRMIVRSFLRVVEGWLERRGMLGEFTKEMEKLRKGEA